MAGQNEAVAWEHWLCPVFADKHLCSVIPLAASQRESSSSAFLPNDTLIYDDPHLIDNTILTLPVDKHIFIPSHNTGLPLTHTWELWGSTGGACSSTHGEIGSVHCSSPASSSVENWEIGRARKCQNVPLKGICERWDQLKFHLTLIFLYHCSTIKSAPSMYAVLVLSNSDFHIPSIRYYEMLHLV